MSLRIHIKAPPSLFRIQTVKAIETMKLLILIASLTIVSARFAKEGVVQNKLHVPADQSVSSFKEEFLPKRGGRVANGASAVDGQFPFAVRLVGMLTATTGFQCTGSLISATYVLSARHCIAK